MYIHGEGTDIHIQEIVDEQMHTYTHLPSRLPDSVDKISTNGPDMFVT